MSQKLLVTLSRLSMFIDLDISDHSCYSTIIVWTCLSFNFYTNIVMNICVTDDHRYVPLVIITNPFFPRAWRLITGFNNKSNTTGDTSEAGIAYPSRATELTPDLFFGILLINLSLSMQCFADHFCFCPFILFIFVCMSFDLRLLNSP